MNERPGSRTHNRCWREGDQWRFSLENGAARERRTFAYIKASLDAPIAALAVGPGLDDEVDDDIRIMERMMYLYVELWNARQEWRALSDEEKQAYLQQVGPGIQTMTDSGVQLVGFALNGEETPQRAGYRYLAAWTMPGPEQVSLLENILEQAGWHDYFEQINARGEILAPEAAIADMAAL